MSPTFRDVLARVEQRDPDSGAILKVRPHPDAPGGPPSGLEFRIEEAERGVVIVTLSQPSMTRIVAEEYRLKVDDAMRRNWRSRRCSCGRRPRSTSVGRTCSG